MPRGIITLNILTDEATETIVSSVLKKATELEKRVCISVYASHGAELAYFKMSKSPELSSQIARDKAYTSACFGVATTDWQEILKNENERVLSGLTRVKGFIAFGGGLPVLIDGELIGGIGVSGASENEDVMCAQAGVDAFLRLSKN